MDDTLNVFKALSDANRTRILCAVRDGELCVCQLIELLGLAPSTVSKHLSILRQASLIQSRKNGRWVYYSLPSKRKLPMLGRITTMVFQTLENTPEIKADNAKLKKIRKMDMEKLCRRILER
ncbi:MAG: metalloregulator ArsR/SmtB family transcription factor [Verrucomicrobia bacterium]|nr:metalloregulator ArsR/SmtB family transcription factor [Verrucomicrobiota bacterium]